MIKPFLEPFKITCNAQCHRDKGIRYWGADYGMRLKPLVAMHAGTVVNTTDKYGGRIVKLFFNYKGDEYEVQYVHLKSFNIESGKMAQEGDQIGVSGNSGLSSGYHLHLGILINGVRVDPEPIINNLPFKNQNMDAVVKELKRIADELKMVRLGGLVAWGLEDESTSETGALARYDFDTKIVKGERWIGIRWRKDKGEWSDWLVDGTTYGEVDSCNRHSDEMTQWTHSIQGDLVSRTITLINDKISVSKWKKAVS